MRNHSNPQQITLFDAINDGRRSGGGTFRRFAHTYDSIITRESLFHAWEEFLRGKKKKEDVALFRLRLADNLSNLFLDLYNRTYVHGTYTKFIITDPKRREINKSTVRDRVVHHLLYSTLYPYFDTKFIYDSYSCRIGKGTHKAMDRFRDFGRIVSKNNTRTCWVLKCDIKKFFANIDHTILKQILEKHITDSDLQWLLGQIIDSFHTVGKENVGLPLGNLTSQLLVNIYMNECDQFVKHKLKAEYYIRYADDFVFLSDNKQWHEEILRNISSFLQEKLKLSLHPDKVFTKTLASGVDFLGWVHFPTHRVLRTTTKRRMFKHITPEAKPETVQSYLGLLKHGNAHKLSLRIEKQAKG